MRELLEVERRVALPFAQVDVPSGRAVGITTYRDIDERNRTLEVGGTWLGRPWWRSAINTEAKLLFLGHAFETLRANRVAIKTDIRNERSQAAIARLGAKREGVRAPPDDPPGRVTPRHGALLRDPGGVAGRARAPTRPACRPSGHVSDAGPVVPLRQG